MGVILGRVKKCFDLLKGEIYRLLESWAVVVGGDAVLHMEYSWVTTLLIRLIEI